MASSSTVVVLPVRQRIVYATAFYALLMTLVIAAKPSALFDADTGDIRPFGVSRNDQTVFSLGVVTVVLAVLSFYLFCIVKGVS